MGDPIEVLPKWAIDIALQIKAAKEEGNTVVWVKRRNCGQTLIRNLVNTEDIAHEEQSKTVSDGTTDGEQATTEV